MLTISPTHSSALASRPDPSNRARGFSVPSSSTTLTSHRPWPSAPARVLGVAVDRDAALGRAEGVDHLDAEAAGELLDDLRGALVAERDPQRVVGVVGPLGLREEVRRAACPV